MQTIHFNTAHLFLDFAVADNLGKLDLECVDIAGYAADEGRLAVAAMLVLSVDGKVFPERALNFERDVDAFNGTER